MMTSHIRRVNPEGSRVYMGTLTMGEEVISSLSETANKLNIRTAVFYMLGGLTEVEFKAFDFESRKRKDPIPLITPMEIISGHGTIVLLENEPHVHMHFAVAFADAGGPNGIKVAGGHVTRAVAHAVEYTLTAYDGAPVSRAYDPETGLMLWALGGGE